MLRVHPAAEADVIRAAYRALARLYHPDLADSQAARDQMVAINRAWGILGDPTTRAAYDRDRAVASPVTRATAMRSAGPAGPSGPVASDPANGGGTVATPAWMARHAVGRRPGGGWGAGAAGPPPGRPSGSVLDFGIYLGWSLGEVERRDPGYIDWLADRPEGDPFRAEVRAIRASRSSGTGSTARRWPRFGFG